VAIMVAVHSASGIEYVLIAGALVSAMVTVFLILSFSTVLHRILRPAGTILLTRIAGVLLAAIAVQMAAEGVLGFLGR
jgi:multiple antibiotic resistance protein